MKPGYRSTEFWLSLLSQALAFALLLGFVNVNDSRLIEEALGKVVAAVFTILASGKVVIEYIRSRTAVKTNTPSQDNSATPPLGLLAILLTGALTLGPLAQTLQAQPLLPWRQQVNERLRFQEKLLLDLLDRKDAPIQVLPIPGDPRQQLPIPGQPKQDLPIGGDPRQTPPIQGEPKQPLPPGGPPKQDLPLAPPGNPQRLSVIRTLSPVWLPR